MEGEGSCAFERDVFYRVWAPATVSGRAECPAILSPEVVKPSAAPPVGAFRMCRRCFVAFLFSTNVVSFFRVGLRPLC